MAEKPACSAMTDDARDGSMRVTNHERFARVRTRAAKHALRSGASAIALTTIVLAAVATSPAAMAEAPMFADDTLTREVAENSAPDTNIGSPIPAATDPDPGDTLTYSMGGTDAPTFTFDDTTRQIKTEDALDFEAESSYSVTITVTDSTSMTDTVDVTITVTDVSDNPEDRGVTASVAAITVDEGGTNTYTVVLETQPTGEVTVRPTVSGNNDVTVRPVAVTFTRGNWSTAQTFTVSAGHDDDATDNSAIISHEASGANYAQVRADDVRVTVSDEDTPGVTLSTNSVQVREGRESSYTIVLNTRPTGTVTVRPTLSDDSDGDVRARPSTLRFTTRSWNTAQTVTVSANEDQDSTADSATINHAVAGADYEGTSAGQVSVTVSDDDVDSSAILLQVSHDSVPEGGAREVTVTGELNASPRDTDTVVTLTLEADSAQAEDFNAIAPVELVIIAGRTSASAQVTITPIDDAIDEVAEETLRIATATTLDLDLRPNTGFTISIEDDDEAGITLSRTALIVREEGSASYTIRLNSQPTQNIQIDIARGGNNGGDLSVTPQRVQFSETNWNTAHTVTVQASEDPDADDGDAEINHQAGAAEYAGIAALLPVTITDIDEVSQRVALTLDNDQIDEEGGPRTIKMTATLDGAGRSQDTHVNVRVVAGTATEGVDFAEITGATITIPQRRTSGEQRVTFRPVNDDIDEGFSETVIFAGTSAGLTVGQTRLSIIDDDGRGIEVPEGAVRLTEEDVSGGSYHVVLATKPTGTVTIRITVSGNAQVTVEPTSLVFTSASWNTAQRVTVRSAHDDNADEESATLHHEASGADYAGVSARPVRVEIEDNDNRRVTLTPRRIELREGGQTTYTAVLDTLPTGTVTVEPRFEPNSDSDITLRPPVLRFTPRNWNVRQTVTVSAAQDSDHSADSARIRHTISGADYGKAHVSVSNIRVRVTDDDTASTAVVVKLSTDTVAEHDAGAQITLTAELDGAAHGEDVEIEVDLLQASDAEEEVDFRGNRVFLTIAAGRTSTTGRIAIRPIDDEIDEGESESMVLHIATRPRLEVRPGPVLGIWIKDDDEAAFVLSRNALTVREEGTASYTLRLDSEPTGTVTVTPSATGADAADLTVRPATLSFTNSNWRTPQRVTVEASEDADGDDDRASIAHTATGASYEEIRGNVEITIDDIDLASRRLSIALDPGQVNEGAETQNVTVVAELDGAARSTHTNVAVRITGGSAREVTDFASIGTVTVIIPAGETRATQSFGFSPVDDSIDEGTGETVAFSATAQGLTSASATLTITDNDGKGIAVSEGTVTLNEDDAEGATYTVTLMSEPSGTVTVRVAVSGNNEVRASPQRLTFTATDWNAAQTVTVTAEHDDDGQTDTAQIRHTASGADYAGVSAVSVAVTVNDDDIRGVTISHTELTVREGGRDSYTVVLDTRPTGTVTVTPTVSGDDDVRVSPSTLRFSASRWNTPLTVTVTGAQDSDQTADSATIAHTVAGADYGTEAVQASDVEVTITDDDMASTSITISLSTQSVQESGGPARITVIAELDASPVEDDTTVTLTLGRGTAQNSDFVGIDPVPLTIRGGQTRGSAHLTVTPVADYIDEGTGETLRLTATTIADLELRPQATFEITIEDDDGPASDAITLAVSTQTLRESAGETQITVTAELNAGPANNDIIVTLRLEPNTAGIDDFAQIEPVNLTIERGRTNGSAQVQVNPVNDDIDEGAGEILRLFADVSQPFAGLRIDPQNTFDLTIEDDDEAGLVFSRNALTVREGESATYTVRLDSQPTGPVTMTLSVTGTDAEKVTANAESIVFRPADWSTPRTVTVNTTKDDDGTPESAEIGHTLAGGGYDDISGEVTIRVEDIDTASRSVQIAIEPDQVEEDDATTTVKITATLDKATRSVATSVDLSATGGTATSGTDFADIGTVMVNIPAGEVSATQTFHFTPTDDEVDEGLSETVIFNARVDGLRVYPATMTIIDNDGRGIELSKGSVDVEEGNAVGGSYSVALATEPSGTVTVRVNVGDNRDVSATPNSLTFTRTSWQTAQTVTVTAAHDDDARDESAKLRHTASGADYSGVRALALDIAVEDDDTEGVTISKTEVEINEGGRERYTVVLDTAPSGTVTVRMEIGAGGDEDVTTSPTSLRFTSRNWNRAQTVTVTAAQDFDDANDAATIEHVVTSGNYAQNAESAGNVKVMVEDDDTASTQVTISTSRSTVHESAGRTQINVTASLDASPMGTPIEIELAFTAGEATEGDDYAAVTPVNMVIAPGRTTANATINLTPINDRIDEGDGETLNLGARTRSGLTIEPATPFEITIEDDDEVGFVFSHPSVTVLEEGKASYTVKLNSQPIERAIMLLRVYGNDRYSVEVSTDGLDFTQTIDRLDFTQANWDTPQTITVKGKEDSDGNDASAVIEHTTAKEYGDLRIELPVTVDDIDLTSTSVQLTLMPTQIAEGGGQRSVTVEAALNGVGLTADKAVAVQVTGGTASAPDDFTDIGTVTVTIPQGETKGTQTFNFTPANDNIDEGLGETVVFGGTAPGLTVGTATLTIADDDGKGIMLSQSTVNVTEGTSASYTVALATQPTGPVTVQVRVTGSNDVTVTPNSVEFTASSWNTPKTVTINAGHDADAAADQAELSHAGSGGGYNGVTALALTVDVADDDTQGVTISKDTIAMAEGEQETYTVVLDTKPTGPVTIEPMLKAGSDEDIRVSPQRLTFTPSSWNTAKTVTVSAAQDADSTNDDAMIEHSVSGADYGEAGTTAEAVSVTVTDDDIPSTQITLGVSTQTVREGAGTTPITVTAQLNGVPAGVPIEIMLSLEGSAGGAQDGVDFATLAPVTLTIGASATSARAQVPVTPIDDRIDEDAGETLQLVAQTDSGLTLAPASRFDVTIEDDDERGFVLSKSSETLSEGENTTYTVKLATQPTENVTVTMSPSNLDLRTNPQSLNFTASSWNTAQTVTVSAEDDADANDETGTIVHEAAEGDYAGVRGEIAITILDKTGGPIVTGATISPTPPGASAVGRSPHTKDGLMALPANAVHGPGANLVFTVTFSRAVTVVPDPNTRANPELEFQTYGHRRTHRARYRGGSGTTQLTFGWTVGRGDYDPNGPGGVRFAVNGSKIEDGTGRNANTAITNADLEAHRMRGGFYNMRLSTQGTTVREGDQLEISVTRSGGQHEPAFARVKVTDSSAGVEDAITTHGFPFGFGNGPGQEADQAVSVHRIKVPGDGHTTTERTLTLEITDSDFNNGWYEIGAPETVTIAVTDNGLETNAPRLSVQPTSAHEAPGATLDFEVTLTPASSNIVTVDYATRDGTATVADADYVATSGTLTFAAGETTHIVPVEVLPDAHDEGTETVWLVLSNPQGAQIERGENSGQIHNDGPIPKAWNARFGRTVATQVIDAIEGRMDGPRETGTQLRVANPQSDEEAALEAERRKNWIEPQSGPQKDITLAGRDLITGSSFNMTTRTKAEDLVSLWGEGAVTRFDGREGDLAIDGEVVTGMVGADWTRERWTTGIVFAHSIGEGTYGPQGENGEGEEHSGMSGGVESTLTSLFPWTRHVLSPRLELWSTLGYGTGELTVTPKKAGTEEDAPALRADLKLWSAAAGLRAKLREGGDDGVSVTGKSDAMIVQTSSGRARGADGANLEPARATVTRLRLGVEGEQTFTIGTGTELTPSAEFGIRHDSGDAETGYGLNVGAGLKLSDRMRGFEAEIAGRGLLTHEASGFADHGVSGSVAWRQRPSSEQGAKLTLTQTFGGTTVDGVDALLTSSTLDALAANDDGGEAEPESRRLELKLGYGLPAFGGRFTWTPEMSFGLSETERDVSLGWQLIQDRSRTQNGRSFELTFEARRRESVNDDTAPEHEVGLKLRMRF